MKSKLDKMDYAEFREHLKEKAIAYSQKTYVDFLSEMIEVSPKSREYHSKSFFKENGNQYVENKHPIEKTRLDFMDYKEFIEYLSSGNIKYEELRDWDFFILDYILVTPISKKLKARTFFVEDGSQAFDCDFVPI